MSRDKKLLILLSIVIAILLAITLAAVATTIIVLRNQKPAAAPPKSEEPTVKTPAVNKPSKFATDAGLLKLRDDVKALGSKVDSVDLFEPEISPPNLDLNIRIN